MNKHIRGLTLIELIVVLAIVAILAVVGYPSYQTYLIESRRTDAINGLRANQLIIENYMQENGVTPDPSAVTLETVSPAGFYTLDYTQDDDDSYQLVATADPANTQNNDTGCTTITLISQMDNIYPTYCN
jgi:type IV pilus assembly protein PilE